MRSWLTLTWARSCMGLIIWVVWSNRWIRFCEMAIFVVWRSLTSEVWSGFRPRIFKLPVVIIFHRFSVIFSIGWGYCENWSYWVHPKDYFFTAWVMFWANSDICRWHALPENQYFPKSWVFFGTMKKKCNMNIFLSLKLERRMSFL